MVVEVAERVYADTLHVLLADSSLPLKISCSARRASNLRLSLLDIFQQLSRPQEVR